VRKSTGAWSCSASETWAYGGRNQPGLIIIWKKAHKSGKLKNNMACVLFVDDDILTLELMAKAAQILRHETMLAATAAEALHRIAAHTPDLIFVDIGLYDMNGLVFVQHLKQDLKTSSIPVIVVSAGQTGRDEQQAREAGAVQYLHKPLSLHILEAAIQRFNPTEKQE